MMMWRGTTLARPFLDGRTMVQAGHRRAKFVVYPIEPVRPDGLQRINWICDRRLREDGFGGGLTAPSREDWSKPGSLDDLLPEAFESQVSPSDLFMALLLGLVFFFLLDKAELWHHGHEHSHHGHGDGHAHAHVHAPAHAHENHEGHDHGHAHHHGPRAGGWAVLTGDSVHCFGDGILIASAFMADMRLGVIAAVSVMAHEVPHHMGDLVVLRQTSPNRRMALVKVSLAGAVTALGGLVGYFLVGQLHDWLPYFLAVASSSSSVLW